VSDLTPTPLILDTSVLTAVARRDPDIIGLIQGYDSRNQPMVIKPGRSPNAGKPRQ
jgi:hypothetical protein